MRGLDFGSGADSAVAPLLRRAGLPVDNYDPYYFPNEDVFENQYDVITSTEVFEHLFAPKDTLVRVLSILNSDGYLGLMTALHDDINFEAWYYPADPTHVVFYSTQTMNFIAKAYNLELCYIQTPAIIFRKL